MDTQKHRYIQSHYHFIFCRMKVLCLIQNHVYWQLALIIYIDYVIQLISKLYCVSVTTAESGMRALEYLGLRDDQENTLNSNVSEIFFTYSIQL